VTTLEIPSGRTAVVRGLHMPGDPAPELLMLVKATVVDGGGRSTTTAPAAAPAITFPPLPTAPK